MKSYRLLCWYIEQGRPNPLDGIPSTSKAALTRAYKEGSKSRMVRATDFVTFPGMKKASKKRIAAILEPSDNGIGEKNEDVPAGSEEENSSDTKDLGKLFVVFVWYYYLFSL